MAARKCPYCKAIIDESLQYCSNCGTQLLFPEDEDIEEGIPGEKIVEEEEEMEEEIPEKPAEDIEKKEPSRDKEEVAEEPSEPPPPEEEVPEPSETPPPQDEIKEEPKEAPPPDSLKFDTADLDQVPDAKTKDLDEMKRVLKSLKEKAEEERPRYDEDRTPPLEEKEEEGPEPTPEELPEEQAVEVEQEEEPSQDFEQAEEEIPEKEEAPSFEEKEKEELEQESEQEISEDERKERDDIDRFLESVKEERADQALAFEKSMLSTTPEEKEAEKEPTPDELIELEEKEKTEVEKFVKEVKEEREGETGESLTPEEVPSTPEGIKVETSELKKDLPPWAEKIKETQPPEIDETEEKVVEEEMPEEEVQEEEPAEEASSMEFVSEEPTIPDVKAPFPESAEEEDEIFKEEAEEEAEEKAEGEVFEKRMREVIQPPSKLSIWLISRAFDLLTTGACWFITLWIASRLVGVSLFQLISVSALPAIGFYLIILFIYCGFFLLFLGETLGRYVFSQE